MKRDTSDFAKRSLEFIYNI